MWHLCTRSCHGIWRPPNAAHMERISVAQASFLPIPDALAPHWKGFSSCAFCTFVSTDKGGLPVGSFCRPAPARRAAPWGPVQRRAAGRRIASPQCAAEGEGSNIHYLHLLTYKHFKLYFSVLDFHHHKKNLCWVFAILYAFAHAPSCMNS